MNENQKTIGTSLGEWFATVDHIAHLCGAAKGYNMGKLYCEMKTYPLKRFVMLSERVITRWLPSIKDQTTRHNLTMDLGKALEGRTGIPKKLDISEQCAFDLAYVRKSRDYDV